MRRLALLVLAAAASAADPVRVPEAVDLLNRTDPVTGKKVVAGQNREWNGVRVHFAGPESIATFDKDPAKVLLTLKLKVAKTPRGVTVVSLENRTCPVSGGKTDPRHFVDRAGVRILLSDPKHAAAVRKDPAKALKALGYGHVPSVVDLRNTVCPVTRDKCYMEAPIWVDVDGIRIRVCCDHCVKEVESDPKRTFQALMVDPEKVKKTVR